MFLRSPIRRWSRRRPLSGLCEQREPLSAKSGCPSPQSHQLRTVAFEIVDRVSFPPRHADGKRKLPFFVLECVAWPIECNGPRLWRLSKVIISFSLEQCATWQDHGFISAGWKVQSTLERRERYLQCICVAGVSVMASAWRGFPLAGESDNTSNF